jgi:predicted transcriptional regulator
MVSPIPKWVWKRYAKLWQKFADKPFTFEQAQKELKHLDRNTISVMFNELKTAGWIKASLNEKDSRFRVYNLINPEQIVESVENDIKKH